MSRNGKFSLSDFLLSLYWLIYIPDTDGAKEKTRYKCQTEVNQHIVPSTYYDVISKRRKGETRKFLTWLRHCDAMTSRPGRNKPCGCHLVLSGYRLWKKPMAMQKECPSQAPRLPCWTTDPSLPAILTKGPDV